MSFLEWIILEGVGKILKVNNFNNSWGLERSFRKLYYFFPVVNYLGKLRRKSWMVYWLRIIQLGELRARVSQ